VSIPRLNRNILTPGLVGDDKRERERQAVELNHQLDELYSWVAAIAGAGVTGELASGGGPFVVHGDTLPDGLPEALLHRSMAGNDLHWPKIHGDVYHNAAHGETPAGAINNANKVFTLASTPDPSGSLILILQNVPQMNRALAGAGAPAADMMGWYSLAGDTITYEVAPLTGFTHLAWYWH